MTENILETKAVLNTIGEFLSPEPWYKDATVQFDDSGTGYKIIIKVAPGMKEQAEEILSDVKTFAILEVLEVQD